MGKAENVLVIDGSQYKFMKTKYMAYVAPSRPKNESVTDGPTDRPTDTRSHKVAVSRLTIDRLKKHTKAPRRQ